jgi:hypothetical protein
MPIRKGDRLVHRQLGPVTADADEKDNTVQVTDGKGAHFTVSTFDMKPAGPESHDGS